MAFDPDLPAEYQVDPSPGSREFRFAVLDSYCSEEEAEKVIEAIESDPEKSYCALAAVDAAFVLGVASVILGKETVNQHDVETALRNVDVTAPIHWGST